ncbi:MAG: NAD+ synthase [Planctomycetota bacterium]
MRVALAQINTTVADFAGNCRRIEEAYRRGAAGGAEIVLFPELAIPGYPPLDLLHRGDFVDSAVRSLEELAPRLDGPPAVVGTVRRNPSTSGRPLFNSAVVIEGGRIAAWRDKALLPTYDVFDEGRYFEPAESPRPVEIAGRRVGIAICEDLWNPGGRRTPARYRRDPGRELVDAGAELILSPAASPFHRQKPFERREVLLSQARNLAVPVLTCNLVGGNTDLIFDGGSLLATPAGTVDSLPRFVEEVRIVDAGAPTAAAGAEPGESAPPADEIDDMARALILGIRDYFHKCGFESAVIGLSGGIDSAVTALLAVEALGPDAVRGLAMPSRHSSEASLTDAEELARRLAIGFDVIPIDSLFSAFLEALAGALPPSPSGITEENLQARIRGVLLMAISNRCGGLVLATGNKSELAVGYCTLYGDMCGGLAPLGDVPKIDVYRIARLGRFQGRIPQSSLDRPPSAELRPGQTDEDTLPPYETLDAILAGYVEHELGAGDIAGRGFAADLIGDVVERVERNEYKRRQAAPALRVTPKAFGIGRRLPIARGYNKSRLSHEGAQRPPESRSGPGAAGVGEDPP